jgi:hypothetical protein
MPKASSKDNTGDSKSDDSKTKTSTNNGNDDSDNGKSKLYCEKLTVKTASDNKTHGYFTKFYLTYDVNNSVAPASLICGHISDDVIKYWANNNDYVTVYSGYKDDDKPTEVFYGKVTHVRQRGYQLELQLDNIGRRFKQKIPEEFRSSYIFNQNVRDAFQAICEFIGVHFVCPPHVDLDDQNASSSTDANSANQNISTENGVASSNAKSAGKQGSSTGSTVGAVAGAAVGAVAGGFSTGTVQGAVAGAKQGANTGSAAGSAIGGAVGTAAANAVNAATGATDGTGTTDEEPTEQIGYQGIEFDSTGAICKSGKKIEENPDIIKATEALTDLPFDLYVKAYEEYLEKKKEAEEAAKKAASSSSSGTSGTSSSSGSSKSSSGSSSSKSSSSSSNKPKTVTDPNNSSITYTLNANGTVTRKVNGSPYSWGTNVTVKSVNYVPANIRKKLGGTSSNTEAAKSIISDVKSKGSSSSKSSGSSSSKSSGSSSSKSGTGSNTSNEQKSTDVQQKKKNPEYPTPADIHEDLMKYLRGETFEELHDEIMDYDAITIEPKTASSSSTTSTPTTNMGTTGTTGTTGTGTTGTTSSTSSSSSGSSKSSSSSSGSSKSKNGVGSYIQTAGSVQSGINNQKTATKSSNKDKSTGSGTSAKSNAQNALSTSTANAAATGTSGTATGANAGMTVVVNSDNIQGKDADQKRIDACVSALQQAGYTAKSSGIDPNAHCSDTKSNQNSYIVCIVGGGCSGTFNDMLSSGYQSTLKSNSDKVGIAFMYAYSKLTNGLKGVSWLPRAHDDTFSDPSFTGMSNPVQTLQQGGIGYCESGDETQFPQEVVKMVSGSAGAAQSTGGGSLIYKDKTFEDCIRRICESTDSVFIVECNAAFLFPYTDWMQLLNQKKGIKHIYKMDMDTDTFEFNYANDGFYNSVTVKYKGGSVTEKYEDLIKIYGENNKEFEDEEIDEDTARYKANSYLAQYVRAYNNKTRLRALQRYRYLGGNFYTVQNPLTNHNEFYFLKGFSMRTQKKQPLYIDLELGFGPDNPEDIEEPNGGSGTGGTTSGGTKDQICQTLAQQIRYSFDYTCDWSDAACVLQEGKTDCFGMSNLLYTQLTAAGVQARVIEYASSAAPSGRHRSVQTNEGGTWTDIDYRSYGFDTNFVNMQTKSGCQVLNGGGK